MLVVRTKDGYEYKTGSIGVEGNFLVFWDGSKQCKVNLIFLESIRPFKPTYLTDYQLP